VGSEPKGAISKYKIVHESHFKLETVLFFFVMNDFLMIGAINVIRKICVNHGVRHCFKDCKRTDLKIDVQIEH